MISSSVVKKSSVMVGGACWFLSRRDTETLRFEGRWRWVLVSGRVEITFKQARRLASLPCDFWEIIIAHCREWVFASAAVRGYGGSAGEIRQVLIEATVVCPGLPRIPWQHFFLRGKTSRHKTLEVEADAEWNRLRKRTYLGRRAYQQLKPLIELIIDKEMTRAETRRRRDSVINP